MPDWDWFRSRWLQHAHDKQRAQINWRFRLNSKTDELCRWQAVWKGETIHCLNLEPVLTRLAASNLLQRHRNPDEKSEIATKKEEKQRCGKPPGDQRYSVSMPKGPSCHYTVSELPKFVKNEASSQSHPAAEGGLPAVQQHLHAGYHHLLLPVCKTTCYQKVPLQSKDTTS